MKKLLFVLVSIFCLAVCLPVFTACNDGNTTALLVGESIDSAEEAINLGDYDYGNDGDIVADINALKFCTLDDGGNRNGIDISKLTATYTDENGHSFKTKPDRLIAGEWSIKYTYKENTCEVQCRILQSTTGTFTVSMEKNSWIYGETLPLVTVRNPDGQTVVVSSNTELSPDDTDVSAESVSYMGIRKDLYNTFSDEEANDSEFLFYLYTQAYEGQYGDRIICSFDSDISYKYRPAEYVMVVLIVQTYNYRHIACKTEFTVNYDPSVAGSGFLLTNIQAVGVNEGYEPTQYFVDMAEELFNKQSGQFCGIDFTTGGSVTGECDLGTGELSLLKGNDAFTYQENNQNGTVNVVMSNKNGVTYTGVSTGATLTLTRQMDDNTLMVFTFIR